MSDSRSEFLARARGAIQDPQLQEALDLATGRFLSLRRTAFRGLANPDGLRERAKAIKQRTLRELDRHLERLASELTRAGGHIHFAADGQECADIVLRLARERGVRSVVKSKSMATEEIHLNQALGVAGITVGETLPPEPEVLTAAARRALRQKFLGADMGVSGANFAVAETGTIVLVTNEGNGRLVTTLPRIHVAIMGMEKVIPALTDLMVFLQLLARSASGQKMSVYTSLIRGPRRKGETDGPEEVHLVIMDNGRSRQVGGPLEESL